MSTGSRAVRALVASCAFVACVGCQNTVYVASRGAYVDTRRYPRGTPFSISTTNTFAFCGLLPEAKVVHVDRLVSNALRKDVRIITGLKIAQYTELGDALFQAITLGFVVPRTLVVEGVYHEEGLPTSPVP